VPPPSSVGLASGLAERSALINAAILALMDAGIECEGVLVAVSLARVGDELLLDPTPEEEASADSGHGFVFCFKGRASEPDCVGIETVGSFNEEEVSLLAPSRIGFVRGESRAGQSLGGVGG